MKSANAHGFLNGKHLLVLGAGYVGGAVANMGLAAGARVTILTRNPAKAEVLAIRGAEAIVADLASDDWYESIKGAPDFVLNCVSSGGGGVEGYRQSYLAGMMSVRAWSAQCGIAPHLVYTSSTSVYGQDGGAEVGESDPASATGEKPQVLLSTEAQVATWAGPWTILRLAGIYGPGRHYLLDQLRAEGRPISGLPHMRLNLIHRDDAAAAVLSVFAQPDVASGEIYNVADDDPAPKIELVRWLAERLSQAVPDFTGRGMPGRRSRPLDRSILNTRLKRELGWRPTYPTFREGYASLLEA